MSHEPAAATAPGALLVDTVVENLRARGATHLFVNANPHALDFYERLGFREESRNLVLPLEVREVGAGRSFGSIHVQTDDLGCGRAGGAAVRPAAARRLARQRASTPPRNGWITVYDDACDRDPSSLRRLAKELSERMGAVVIAIGVEHEQVVRFVLLEAGRIVDEYLSVPEYYGPLPPGDAIALAANPRVVARLTGADPAAVRAVARTAPSPAELPPPLELLAALARDRDRARARGRRADPARSGEGVITLYDAARCPYCARVRIVLAEKGIPYETVEIDLARPSRLAVREEPGRQGAGARGGRLDPARVGRDRRVPERALPRAAAAGRTIPASARPDGCSSSASTTSRSRTTRSGAARRERASASRTSSASSTGCSGRPVAVRARLRARRRRLPALDAARARHARDPARAVAGARRLARARLRCGLPLRRSAAGRGAVTRRPPARLPARRADVAHGCRHAPRLYGLGQLDGRVGRRRARVVSRAG